MPKFLRLKLGQEEIDEHEIDLGKSNEASLSHHFQIFRVTALGNKDVVGIVRKAFKISPGFFERPEEVYYHQMIVNTRKAL